MDKLTSIRAFTRVVQHGSFAAAARELRLSRSAVSKYVIELEQELGSQLLVRTTRSASPTENGHAYYERCIAILADLEEADRAVTRLQSEPRGLLRVNAPMSFGTLHLGRAVADFMQKYPELQIQLILSDQQIDPVQEGFDVTLRIAELASSSLIARKIASALRVVCAAPAYLARRGIPEHPAALREHDCLTYGYLATGNQWKLTGPDGDHWIHSLDAVQQQRRGAARRRGERARHRLAADIHRGSRSAGGQPAQHPDRLRRAGDFRLRDLSADAAPVGQGADVHRFPDRALRRPALLGSGQINPLSVKLI
jgi:DNA-binding transcriptional LysR family regulator